MLPRLPKVAELLWTEFFPTLDFLADRFEDALDD